MPGAMISLRMTTAEADEIRVAAGKAGQSVSAFIRAAAAGRIHAENAGDRELLTGAERKAVQRAGQLYTFIAAEICGHGPTREDDLAELRAAVHVIQQRLMSQAAARAYPGEFRLMGEVIESA